MARQLNFYDNQQFHNKILTYYPRSNQAKKPEPDRNLCKQLAQNDHDLVMTVVSFCPHFQLKTNQSRPNQSLGGHTSN